MRVSIGRTYSRVGVAAVIASEAPPQAGRSEAISAVLVTPRGIASSLGSSQ